MTVTNMRPADWIEINDLMTRYAATLEAGDFAGLGDCFTEDMYLDLSDILGPDKSVGNSRAAAVGMIEHRRATSPRVGGVRRHLFSNLLVRTYTEREVTSQLSVMYVVTPADGSTPHVFFTGQYDDTIRKESDDRWRFARRVLRVDKPGTMG